MAYTDIHVSGPAVISISKTGSTPVRWGVCDEAVQVRLITFFEDVLADDLGPSLPVDRQYLGQIAMINGRFSRYDESLMEEVRARVPILTPGQIDNEDIGMLTITGGETFEVYIEGFQRTQTAAQAPWRFPTCIPDAEMALNLGTKFSKASWGFTAYPNSGTLYARV